MAPHCDTMDGPVIEAARRAIESANVNLVLPYAPAEAEEELREDFRKTLLARTAGPEAAEIADLWFFENLVRLHRQGEGAPYTGLKPAGLDWGPVIPRAERALESGDASEVISFLQDAVAEIVQGKLDRAKSLEGFDPDDVGGARHYVHAMLDFILFSAHLYIYMRGGGEHAGAEAG